MATSQPRQNYHVECEAGVNKQINMELYASYVYTSMNAWQLPVVETSAEDDVSKGGSPPHLSPQEAYYFNRDDVALKGFYKFFKSSSDEEREHAEKLMKYQNMRGGRIVLQNIQKPSVEDWGTGLDAMQAALDLEKTVNQSLLDLHRTASNHNDVQMCDFLETEYLKEQVESIKQLSDYVTNLKRVGSGLGEFMFDKETLKGEDD